MFVLLEKIRKFLCVSESFFTFENHNSLELCVIVTLWVFGPQTETRHRRWQRALLLLALNSFLTAHADDPAIKSALMNESSLPLIFRSRTGLFDRLQ